MTTPLPEYSPLRASLFQRWMLIWHAVYIGGLLLALGAALWVARGAWGWREAALAGIVAALLAGYWALFVREVKWPHPNWLLALYFAGVLALLALAAWLNGLFVYVIGMLFGQMFALLPPALALPGVAAVLGVILLAANDWRLPADVSWLSALFVAAQLGLMYLLYLYIYHVFRTSQERAGLVNELRAANEQLARAEAEGRELAALRERERMARDLHDGLGHSLAALSVHLEAVQRLYPVDPERASAQIDAMKRLTRDSMAELRRALDDLRAPADGGEPLAAALERLCAGLAERTGMVVERRIDTAALAAPPAVAEALRRVAGESLANVERHAGATRVQVELRAEPGVVVLRVADDGRGLPADAEARPGHYGLRGMRERVEGLGGTLSLGGAGGATVVARLPVVARA